MKNKNIKIFPIIDNIDDYANGHGCGKGYGYSNGSGKGYGFLPILLYINSKGDGKTNIIYIDENGNKQY
jgi:hypothetical protein